MNYNVQIKVLANFLLFSTANQIFVVIAMDACMLSVHNYTVYDLYLAGVLFGVLLFIIDHV